jgi:hypothetical protein
MLLLTIFISIFIICSNKAFLSQTPKWLTSPYFIADNQAVISVLTGSGQTPSYQFIYSTAFLNTPNIAYGIKNYRGSDVLIKVLINYCSSIFRSFKFREMKLSSLFKWKYSE